MDKRASQFLFHEPYDNDNMGLNYWLSKLDSPAHRPKLACWQTAGMSGPLRRSPEQPE